MIGKNKMEPNPLPDRKALDDIVFDALGINRGRKKRGLLGGGGIGKKQIRKGKERVSVLYIKCGCTKF